MGGFGSIYRSQLDPDPYHDQNFSSNSKTQNSQLKFLNCLVFLVKIWNRNFSTSKYMDAVICLFLIETKTKILKINLYIFQIIMYRLNIEHGVLHSFDIGY